MDIYSLLKHKRPKQLTLAKPDSKPPEPSTRESFITEKSLITQDSQNITGPSRDHWKPNSSTMFCSQRGCSNIFGALVNRHHCRYCGGIFCDVHCSESIRLDRNALFNTKGILCRGCDKCALYYLYEMLRTKRRCVDGPSAPITRDKHRSIMTLEPQAMEGIMEIGRDDIVLATPVSVIISKTSSLDKFDPMPPSTLDGWQWSTF
ncbi:hypothetical protein CLU79DRAFT_836119 [Phycomyces nitens]|nr:hypothetical protein CLU79DRAFT_836119 [Phycomyces nitens]